MGESSEALKHFPGGALISLQKELCTHSTAALNLQRSYILTTQCSPTRSRGSSNEDKLWSATLLAPAEQG